MIGVFDELLASLLLTVRQPIEAYVELETADDETMLAARDGSLVSYVKIFSDHGRSSVMPNING